MPSRHKGSGFDYRVSAKTGCSDGSTPSAVNQLSSVAGWVYHMRTGGRDILLDSSASRVARVAVNTGLKVGTSQRPSSVPRTYEQTHPWIDFRLNLARAPYRFWMLLGEARSKCDMIAGVPLPPRTADELHVLYLAKGALATTAIEGNTLSAEEVHKLLRGQLDLPPSKEYLAREVDNVIDACNDILSDIGQGTVPPLSPRRVKKLNTQVLKGLDVGQKSNWGECGPIQLG